MDAEETERARYAAPQDVQIGLRTQASPLFLRGLERGAPWAIYCKGMLMLLDGCYHISLRC